MAHVSNQVSLREVRGEGGNIWWTPTRGPGCAGAMKIINGTYCGFTGWYHPCDTRDVPSVN